MPRLPLMPLCLLFACTLANAAPGTRQADGSWLVRAGGASNLFAAAGDAPDKLDWQKAVAFCADSTAHGHDDWRLPDLAELQALYTHRDAIGATTGKIDDNDPHAYLAILQGAEHDGNYWSSARDGNAARGLDFGDGSTFSLQVENAAVHLSARTRCVRGP